MNEINWLSYRNTAVDDHKCHAYNEFNPLEPG